MFRDTSEELARLEAELLAQEEPEEPVYDEEYEDEEFPADDDEDEEWEYEDTRPANGPAVYQNYSNDYGKNLRNYASGYRAYNTDHTDEDLERYSQQVQEPKRSGCVTAIVAVLVGVALLAAAVLLYYAWERGLL